jgi:hypothetical protein
VLAILLAVAAGVTSVLNALTEPAPTMSES